MSYGYEYYLNLDGGYKGKPSAYAGQDEIYDQNEEIQEELEEKEKQNAELQEVNKKQLKDINTYKKTISKISDVKGQGKNAFTELDTSGVDYDGKISIINAAGNEYYKGLMKAQKEGPEKLGKIYPNKKLKQKLQNFMGKANAKKLFSKKGAFKGGTVKLKGKSPKIKSISKLTKQYTKMKASAKKAKKSAIKTLKDFKPGQGKTKKQANNLLSKISNI